MGSIPRRFDVRHDKSNKKTKKGKPMDKPSEPTHGPVEPIHAPHRHSPDPHRRRVRSLEEAARCSLDPATTGADPLGRRRR